MAKMTRYLPTVSQGWRLSQAGGGDLLNMNVSSNRLEHVSGLLDRWYSDAYTTVTAFLNGSTGQFSAAYMGATGLTGATATSRYVGATSGGAPATGTFAVGDFAIDRIAGLVWVCTAAGTPGTWAGLQISSTASNIQPAGIRAAGTVGQAADAGHVHQNNADLSLYIAPAAATGETFPRVQATTYLSGLTSGLVYVSAIPLPAGMPVNNITLMVGSAAWTASTVTHGWYALLDSGLVVRAVSADQTSGNWTTVNTTVPLPVTASGYTTTYGGLYYIAFCATFTGTSGEFPAAPLSIGGLGGLTPMLCGTSSSGLTIPPATGTTLGALSYVGGDHFYAYTS
jgi:hypothetical protein